MNNRIQVLDNIENILISTREKNIRIEKNSCHIERDSDDACFIYDATGGIVIKYFEVINRSFTNREELFVFLENMANNSDDISDNRFNLDPGTETDRLNIQNPIDGELFIQSDGTNPGFYFYQADWYHLGPIDWNAPSIKISQQEALDHWNSL